MAALKLSYLPAPNWDIPADTDIVVLGRIIKDPNDPESLVPKSAVVPPPKTYPGEKGTWAATLERLRSGKVGIWAKFLQLAGLGGDLNLERLKESVTNLTFDQLETEYFLPEADPDYLGDVTSDPYLQGYWEVTKWRKPVYLITGRKIVRGASVKTTNRAKIGGGGNLGVDLTSSGVPLSAGPKMELEKEDKQNIAFGSSTDYVFAYRLLRIKPKNNGAGFSTKGFVKGAAFDENMSNDAKAKTLNDLFDFGDYVEEGRSVDDALEDDAE